MKIVLIYAGSDNGIIGRDGWMPWRQSADLQRFRQLTMGHHIVLGRKTFEALPQPLPGRVHLVLSRQAGQERPNVHYFAAIASLLAFAKNAGETELYVTGGGEIYRHFEALADVIEVTRIHTTISGDVAFDFDRNGWLCQQRLGPFAADAKNEYPYSFETWFREPSLLAQ